MGNFFSAHSFRVVFKESEKGVFSCKSLPHCVLSQLVWGLLGTAVWSLQSWCHTQIAKSLHPSLCPTRDLLHACLYVCLRGNPVLGLQSCRHYSKTHLSSDGDLSQQEASLFHLTDSWSSAMQALASIFRLCSRGVPTELLWKLSDSNHENLISVSVAHMDGL